MGLLRALQRPEYVLRPSQVWRRLRRTALIEQDRVQLAWGLPIRVDSSSHVGVDIANLGVFDRGVPEVICRLLDPGETALDIGANIGQNTSLMALVSGPGGRVLAFEPGTIAWQLLTNNLRRWNDFVLAPVHAKQAALSSTCGEATLYSSTELGGFSLDPDWRPSAFDRPRERVVLTTLDRELDAAEPIGLAKIDVEGHEVEVLEGASKLIAAKSIRDIIYEEMPSDSRPTARLLLDAGYTLFGFGRGGWQPTLRPIPDVDSFPARIGHDFLATVEPERAVQRFKPKGWQCLRVRAQRSSRSDRSTR